MDELLKDNFQEIVNVEFTAQMEEKLDEVAEGNVAWKNVIKDFYDPFEKNLEEVEERIGKVEIKEEVTDIPCEKCGRMMVVKMGRYGKFLACPGFPECRNVKSIVEKLENVKCPNCGGDILIKKSKRGKKYYICENNTGEGGKCQFIAWNGPDKNGVIHPAELEKTKTKKASTKKTKKK